MSSSDIFDFGFTAVTEDELDAVQQANQTIQSVSADVSTTQQKLDKLYNAIQPLLSNLKKNPEKDYIYWPNRLQKVEQFEDYIQGIYSNTSST
jgi:peptidoglycan hydrolase CwlO-like protein